MQDSPALNFAAVLCSDGPHLALPEAQRIFAPFIGSWDLIVRWFDAQGERAREERGEWHFAWVLEGRAIQDVWIVPQRDERAVRPEAGEYGTSLRFYDRDIDAWRSTWIGPFHRYLRRFAARRAGDEVVLETLEDEAPPPMRWIFFDIQADAFRWRNEGLDNGRWRVQQTFDATRRPGHG